MASKSKTKIMKEAIILKIKELKEEGRDFVTDLSQATRPKSKILVIENFPNAKRQRWYTLEDFYTLLVLNQKPKGYKLI